jgi:hypothetical protein
MMMIGMAQDLGDDDRDTSGTSGYSFSHTAPFVLDPLGCTDSDNKSSNAKEVNADV